MRQPTLPSPSPQTTSPKTRKPTEIVAGATKSRQNRHWSNETPPKTPHRIKITMKLSPRNNPKTTHQDKIA
jgi:hypothetical protein